MRVIPALVAMLCVLSVCSGRLVTISNKLPRTDSAYFNYPPVANMSFMIFCFFCHISLQGSGVIMDAHDGKIINVDGVYHWFVFPSPFMVC
jgi:hypothetical protein